jgi:hypothetical protein
MAGLVREIFAARGHMLEVARERRKIARAAARQAV